MRLVILWRMEGMNKCQPPIPRKNKTPSKHKVVVLWRSVATDAVLRGWVHFEFLNPNEGLKLAI